MDLQKTRLLAIVLVIVLFVLSWYTIVNDSISESITYNNYLKVAREKAEATLFDDANDNYNAALEMKDSLKLRLEIADFYLNNKNTGRYVGHCESICEDYPYEAVGYERLIEYYSGVQDIKQCYTLLNTAKKRKVTSDKIEEFRTNLAYLFKLDYMKFGDVGSYAGGFFTAQKRDGGWGYVDEFANIRISLMYEVAKPFSADGLAAVKTSEGKYVLINTTGRTKHVDTENKNIEDCGIYIDGLIPVKYDGKYHYCDVDFKKVFGDYDYASNFNNGVAAVKQGDVWKIVNQKGEEVSSDSYTDIKLDEKGIAFRNNVAFAKKGDKYILIDTKGNQVGKQTFDDACLFASQEPASVKIGDKWGYVNPAGEVVVKPTYDMAKPFSNGFAAVAQGDKWGYIIVSDYSLKIDYQFSDAYNFSNRGTAFVKTEENWSLLTVYSLRYGI